MDQRGGWDRLHKRIKKHKKEVLLQVVGIPNTESSKYNKDDLYRRIYKNSIEEDKDKEEKHVGEVNVGGATAEAAADATVNAPAKKRGEKRCWNAGYWLSYMQNTLDQIEYLGQYRWIW